LRAGELCGASATRRRIYDGKKFIGHGFAGLGILYEVGVEKSLVIWFVARAFEA
jgi:hypothetical protein